MSALSSREHGACAFLCALCFVWLVRERGADKENGADDAFPVFLKGGEPMV